MDSVCGAPCEKTGLLNDTAMMATPAISVSERVMAVPFSELITCAGRGLSKGRCRSRNPGVALLLERIPHRILQAADGVLNLAFHLVALAFGNKLIVADSLTHRFLDGTLILLAAQTIRSLFMSLSLC